MKRHFSMSYLIIILLFGTGCGKSGENVNSTPSPPAETPPVSETGNPVTKLDWTLVDKEFNPKIEKIDLDIDGVSTVRLMIPGFDGALETHFSNDLIPGQAYLKIYTVSRISSSKLNLEMNFDNSEISVLAPSGYFCSISILNSMISSLEGQCAVGFQLVLPISSKVQLIQ